MRLLLLLLAAPAFAQTVTELRLRVEPATVRPLGTAVIQVQVFGKHASGREGRLRRDGWTAAVTGGALSKPFRYQGTDSGSYLESDTSDFGRMVGQGVGQYTVKDAVLFVAPAEPGKYRVTVSMGAVQADAVIEVSPGDLSLSPAEAVTFPPEQKRNDPYRRLAEQYAPVVLQETWFDPRADYLARFDYDGDWRGDNNWDNLASGSSQAYVYYAAMETATHVFLIYNFFHPRDYSDNCLLGSCHENDNEGIIVAVQKDGSEWGRLQVVETLAHNHVLSYVNDASLRPGLHGIEGAVVMRDGSHPVVFLESGGHGAYIADEHRRPSGTAVTYVYKGVAERPASPVASSVGYDLIPIYEEWWLKANGDEAAGMFSDYFLYRPAGGRPRMKNPRIPGAFLGLKQAANKARPFWGWFDTPTRKSGAIATGQWALDPAYALSRTLGFPEGQRYSLEYTWNPFLEIGSPSLSMRAPANFVAAVPVPEGGLAPVPAAAQAARGTSALGQILTGEQRDTLAGVLNRAGVGAGGSEALRQAAEMLGARPVAGQCTVTVEAAGPMEIAVRAAAAEGAKVTCNRPLPDAAVRVRADLRSGPSPVTILEQPTDTNGHSVRLRLTAAGAYIITLTW